MDPITIIGTAGAAANIVEVIGKIVGTLFEIRHQWKDADFTLATLIAQLTVLRVAMTRIEDWAESEPVDHHHQLKLDMDMSINCCGILIGRIDEQLSDLRSNEDGGLVALSKIKLALESSRIEDLEKRIDRQTSALNLLLMACNCQAMSDQRRLLLESSTRNVFERVKEDTASMIVLRDSSSFLTASTGQFSKLSVIFPFDQELLATKVYERGVRGWLKNVLTRRRVVSNVNEIRPDASELSIDNSPPIAGIPIASTRSVARRSAKLLAVGVSDEYLHALQRALPNASIDDDLAACRHLVLDYVATRAKYHAQWRPVLKSDTIAFRHYEYLKTFALDLNQPTSSLGRQFEMAVNALLQDPPGYPDRMDEFAVNHFFNDIRRIARNTYNPTEMDVVRVLGREFNVDAQRFLSTIDFGVPEFLQDASRWNMWQQSVAGPLLILDLASYDQDSLADDPVRIGNLSRGLQSLESMLYRGDLAFDAYFVILTNTFEFARKLHRRPLHTLPRFQSYNGGTKYKNVIEHIRAEIINIHQSSRHHSDALLDEDWVYTGPKESNIFIHIVDDISDASTKDFIHSAFASRWAVQGETGYAQAPRVDQDAPQRRSESGEGVGMEANQQQSHEKAKMKSPSDNNHLNDGNGDNEILDDTIRDWFEAEAGE